MQRIQIDENQANQRFDRFLRKWYKNAPSVSLGDIYRAIRKGEIRLNGKKTQEEKRLVVGDVIELPELLFSSSETKDSVPQVSVDVSLVRSRILYEDEHRLVFNKPAGVVLHPDTSKKACMVDYLEAYLKAMDQDWSSAFEVQTFKASFGYRLDKQTSGVLIAGKTYQSLQYINQIIRERAIEKQYYVLVSGQAPEHALIDKAIEKDYNAKFQRGQMRLTKEGGLASQTEFWREKSFQHDQLGWVSLLRVKLYSGRMHQIRIHLASENLPVLGDLVYGNPAINRLLYKHLHIKRQLLHCWKYEFADWDQKRLQFIAPLPSDFTQLLKK